MARRNKSEEQKQVTELTPYLGDLQSALEIIKGKDEAPIRLNWVNKILFKDIKGGRGSIYSLLGMNNNGKLYLENYFKKIDNKERTKNEENLIKKFLKTTERKLENYISLISKTRDDTKNVILKKGTAKVDLKNKGSNGSNNILNLISSIKEVEKTNPGIIEGLIEDKRYNELISLFRGNWTIEEIKEVILKTEENKNKTKNEKNENELRYKIEDTINQLNQDELIDLKIYIENKMYNEMYNMIGKRVKDINMSLMEDSLNIMEMKSEIISYGNDKIKKVKLSNIGIKERELLYLIENYINSKIVTELIKKGFLKKRISTFFIKDTIRNFKKKKIDILTVNNKIKNVLRGILSIEDFLIKIKKEKELIESKLRNNKLNNLDLAKEAELKLKEQEKSSEKDKDDLLKRIGNLKISELEKENLINSITKEHKEEINRINENYENKISEINTKNIEDFRIMDELRVETERQHKDEIREMKEKYEKEIEEEKGNTKKMDEIYRDLEKELKNEFNIKTANLEEEYNKNNLELSNNKMILENEYEGKSADLDAQKTNLEGEYQAKNNGLGDIYIKKEEELNKKHNKEIEQIKESLQDAKDKLNEENLERETYNEWQDMLNAMAKGEKEIITKINKLFEILRTEDRKVIDKDGNREYAKDLKIQIKTYLENDIPLVINKKIGEKGEDLKEKMEGIKKMSLLEKINTIKSVEKKIDELKRLIEIFDETIEFKEEEKKENINNLHNRINNSNEKERNRIISLIYKELKKEGKIIEIDEEKRIKSLVDFYLKDDNKEENIINMVIKIIKKNIKQ